jgi:outer membrane autotransporter protein
VTITATARSTAAIAANLGVTTGEALALSNANSALLSDATVLELFSDVLVTGGATAKKAAQQLGVQADSLGATGAVAASVGGQVASVTSTRLAALRTGVAYADANPDSGFSAGNGAMSKAMWIRAFGSTAEQDAVGGISGYGADTYGILGGLDWPMGANSRVGVSLSYADTDVSGDGAGNSSTDLESLQANLYGDFTGPRGYVEWLIGIGNNDTSTSRTIDFASATASGSYDSTQYVVSVGAGMPRPLGVNTFFTPTVGLSWTHVTGEQYTETGAGSLNLTVNQDDIDAQVASIGAKLHNVSGSFTSVLRAGIQYDVAGDEAEASSSFSGGGAAFTTTGAEVEQLAGSVGAGVSFDAGGATMMSINYDVLFRDGFTSHTGTVEAKWGF